MPPCPGSCSLDNDSDNVAVSETMQGEMRGRDAMSDANISPAVAFVCAKPSVRVGNSSSNVVVLLSPASPSATRERRPAHVTASRAGSRHCWILVPGPAAWQSLHSCCRNVSITQMRHQNVLLLGLFMYSFTLHVKPGSRDE